MPNSTRFRRLSGPRLLLYFASLLGPACGDQPVQLGGGEDLWVVASIELDASGARVSSTSLRFASESFEVESDRGNRLFALGWSKPALLEAFIELPEPLPDDLLEIASGCVPRLPTPDWTGELIERSFFERDSSAAPETTIQWLSGVCPRRESPPNVTSPISLAGSCAGGACAFELGRDACELELAVSECVQFFPFEGPLKAHVGPDGLVCLETARCAPGATLDCHTQDGRECVIALEEARSSIPVQTDRLEVFEAPPRVPESLPGREVSTAELATGYLADILPLGEELVVATHDGDFAVSRTCRRTDPSRIYFVDRSSLEITGSSTAPPCLTALLEDRAEGESGFLGLFGSGLSISIGRFDRRGGIVKSTRLLSGVDLEGRSPLPVGVAWNPSANDKIAAYLGSGSGNELIVELDVNLEIGEVIRIPVATARAFTVTPQGEFLRAEDGGNKLVWSRGARDVAEIRLHSSGSVRIMPPLVLGDGRVVSSFGGTLPAVQLIPSSHEGVLSEAIFFEAQADATTLVTLGAEPNGAKSVLVGLREHASTAGRAILAILELEATAQPWLPSTLSFRTGSIVVGSGVLAKPRVDRDGWVWFMLPWSAEVLRVRATGS
ncbi:MAG: hypothetical protein HY791_18395 [Deltaproteobacteria bacterium]|nr:hypothetical protein [Deltaproteobacteria bacterium]